ncbi:SatD family protein [Nocardioides sp. Leaf374]|uniref:SatD family protein n=1 Tax=Nocardioides sp. Leaf374 TaxID=2876560 RepID=UPI001E3F1C64|nr:SatD family protein [Nocardioides sp. Leaf374]
MVQLFTLIGDVVGSRDLPDRGAAQRRIVEVLAEVSRALTPAQRLEATVGDELQGAFTTLADAVLATALVRLALLPDVDVRCGLGHGEVTVYDDQRTPLLQDGPGWWAAREALDVLGRPRRASSRTWYDAGAGGTHAGPVNAFLLTRDALLDRLGDRGRSLALAALQGRSQAEIAADQGISRSAVSQQFARGVGALRDAHLSFAAGETEADSGAGSATGPARAGREEQR